MHGHGRLQRPAGTSSVSKDEAIALHTTHQHGQWPMVHGYCHRQQQGAQRWGVQPAHLSYSRLAAAPGSSSRACCCSTSARTCRAALRALGRWHALAAGCVCRLQRQCSAQCCAEHARWVRCARLIQAGEQPCLKRCRALLEALLAAGAEVAAGNVLYLPGSD